MRPPSHARTWTKIPWLLCLSCCYPVPVPPSEMHQSSLNNAIVELQEVGPWITDRISTLTYVYWTQLDAPNQVGVTMRYPGQALAIALDWSLQSYRSILTVLAHEVGHAMGLDHSEDHKSIMYPSPALSTASQAVESLAVECATQPVGCRRLRLMTP